MEKCRDVMTSNPKFCLPEHSVTTSAQVMKKEDVGSVPVVEDTSSRKLIGILTDRDIVLEVVVLGRNASETRVDDIMAKDPVSCSAEDGIERAMELMSRYQIRRIPVVGEGNELLGIISQGDIATRTSDTEKTGHVVKDISSPA